MFKRVTVAIILVFCYISSSNDIQNPALTPVRIKTSQKHKPIELIKNKKADFAIVYDFSLEKDLAQNRQSIHNAVKVLQKAFKKCAGIDVPAIDANDAEGQGKYSFLILVGKSKLTDKLNIDSCKLPPEGFEIITFDKGLAIVGNDGSLKPESYSELDDSRYRVNGTLNGAYDFIERFLGVRFYYPGMGTIWPEISNLAIFPVHYSDWPEFKNRYNHNLAYGNVKKSLTTATVLDGTDLSFEDYWRASMGSRFQASHSPKPQSWLKAHPDKLDIMFYRTREGRVYYEPKDNTGNYLDISNLDLAKLYVEDCKKYYESNGRNDEPWGKRFPPSSQYIFWGQADTFMPFMDNDTISNLGLVPDVRKDSRTGELSDIYARFYIELGKLIQKELPGKRLSVIAYHNYMEAPLKKEYRKIPENVDVKICMYSMPKSVRNENTVNSALAVLKDWYEVLGNRPVAGMWLYSSPNDLFARIAAGQLVGEVPKALGKYLGRECLYFDLYGALDWDLYYSYYVAYRSLWNPEFNVKVALHEHWKLLYGKAAPYLEEFNSILMDTWEKRSKDPKNKKVYSFAILDRLEKLLCDAEKSLAPDSIEMKRYKFFAKRWPAAIDAKRKILKFEKPVYSIKYLPDAVTINIDGNLSEPVWESVGILPMNDPMGSGAKSQSPVAGKFLWNKDGFYVGYAIDSAPLADKDKTLWGNCNLEIFLSPDTQLNEYFHFAINSLNELHSGQKTLKPVETPYNSNWKCGEIKYAVKLMNEKWCIEMFIPFKGLGISAPKAYSCWYANFILNKKSNPPEYLSYSITLGNNHNVDYYGLIKFLGRE